MIKHQVYCNNSNKNGSLLPIQISQPAEIRGIVEPIQSITNITRSSHHHQNNNLIRTNKTMKHLSSRKNYHHRLQHKRQLLLQQNDRPTLIKSTEYKNLRQVVPSLRRQRDVGKVEVVTEAARYIDHLHKTLIERFVLCGIPDSLKEILGTDDANELSSQHIMNLVTSMAAKQHQQQQQSQNNRSQLLSRRPIRSGTNQQRMQFPLLATQATQTISRSLLGSTTTTTTTTTTSNKNKKSKKVLPIPKIDDNVECSTYNCCGVDPKRND